MQIHHPNFKKYLQKEKRTPKLEEKIHKPPQKNKINLNEREREKERLQGEGKNNEGDERSTKHVYYVKE
jgi:hypothetical protein